MKCWVFKKLEMLGMETYRLMTFEYIDFCQTLDSFWLPQISPYAITNPYSWHSGRILGICMGPFPPHLSHLRYDNVRE